MPRKEKQRRGLTQRRKGKKEEDRESAKERKCERGRDLFFGLSTFRVFAVLFSSCFFAPLREPRPVFPSFFCFLCVLRGKLVLRPFS